jgi:hypothetical protein
VLFRVTYSFAELAGNAAFFARGVSSECVFATESGRDGTLRSLLDVVGL